MGLAGGTDGDEVVSGAAVVQRCDSTVHGQGSTSLGCRSLIVEALLLIIQTTLKVCIR
jgi:hypothetical protein